MDIQAARDEASLCLKRWQPGDKKRGLELILEASAFQFQGGRRECKPLPKGERQRLQEMVDSGEADERTVPVADERKKPVRKQVVKSDPQKSLF